MKKNINTNGMIKTPDAPCIECIRKHISLACTLYYEPSFNKTLNILHIQGNFAAAQLHAEKAYPELMQKIRTIRKKYMLNHESLTEQDFINLSNQIDKLN